MIQWLQLSAFGLMAAAGNLLGGWLIARSPGTDRTRLKYLLGFGAGFMLAAVILEMIPESFRQADPAVGVIWLLAGYLIIQFFEHTLAPHFHFGEEVHTEQMHRHGVAVTAVVALAIHAFFDGVTIASGLLVNLRLGLLLFVAVLLHKVPEGFTVASIMVSAGKNRRTALQATLLIAIATFAGIFCVALVERAIAVALPLSAGATLYIATSDLIPEINREGGWKASLFIFAGVALFYLSHWLLHNLLD
ncbi:MAG TPA: ZIP family metal transporter [Blastocatellia bacterium]|nr:ZIP family metal transporter [Blastocatellia bacterium]